MRRENLWCSKWDVWSGTMVVVRARGSCMRAVAAPAPLAVLHAPISGAHYIQIPYVANPCSRTSPYAPQHITFCCYFSIVVSLNL